MGRKKISKRDAALLAGLIALVIAIIVFIFSSIGKLISALLSKNKNSDESVTRKSQYPMDSEHGKSLSAIGQLPSPNNIAGSIRTKKLYWAGIGQSVTVSGYVIKNPMTYWSDEASSPQEASCIDRSIPIGNPDDEDLQALPYWPRYSTLTPGQRGKYLSWISQGRNSDLDEIGYAFIFFYGLERRAIIERKDIDSILEEIRRLLSRYPSSNSFNSYLNHFIAYVVGLKLNEMDESGIQKNFPMLDALDETSMNVVLSFYYRKNKAIPWDLGYAIAKNSSKSNITKKSPDLLKQLFRKKFYTHFPEGMRLDSNDTQIRIPYRPASPTLMNYFRYPDTTSPPDYLSISIPLMDSNQFDTLFKIWTECTEELRPVSNKLTRTEGEMTREVYSALPSALKEEMKHPDKEVWQYFISSKTPVKGSIIVKISELALLLGFEKRETLTATQSHELTLTARDLGYVIVPDHKLSGASYRWKDSVAIIPMRDKKVQPSVNFQKVALIFEMAYALAASDENVSELEEKFLYEFISKRSTLNNFDLECIQALHGILEIQPPSLSKIGKRLSKYLNPDQKVKIANFLGDIVLLDNKFEKREQKSLKSVFKALEIDSSVSDELIRNLLIGQAAEVPTTVVKARRFRTGEAIPALQETDVFRIDEEKLKQRMIETQAVQEILSNVFDQEQQEEESRIEREPVVPVPVTAYTENIALKGLNLPFPSGSLVSLDVKYLLVLNDIMISKELSKDDFTGLVRKHNLMPQAAFDDINSWADEELGDFLLEDHEDRIIINFIH